MKPKVSVILLLFVSANFFPGAAFSAGNHEQPAVSINKPAQKVDNVFRNFFVHRQHNNDIVLNWSVTSSSITNFIVQRSYDGEYYDNIDVNLTTIGRWNRATDKEVFPGYIFYRVIAILNDGTECYSNVQVVRIVRRK